MRRGKQDAPLTPAWTLFSNGSETVAVPQTPLLIRLRRMVSDEFFGQDALLPLKRFMDVVFFAGPGLIMLALYMPQGGGLLVWAGIACLAIASVYWFAPHWMCRIYLARRGFSPGGTVQAPDLAAALSQEKRA